jgi:hypothetical protein
MVGKSGAIAKMTAQVAIHLGEFSNGVAHRTVALLRAVFPLLETKPEGEATRSLDESIVGVVEELNDATVLAMAPDVDALAASLPLLHAAVTERCRILLQTIRQDDQPPRPSVEAPFVERRAAARCPAVDASNPLTLARRAEPEELLRLAAMPEMPECLADILTSRVHLPAIVVALRNPSAAFSRSSLMMLAELAAGDRSLRDALIDYPRLPEGAADRLLPISGREATARLLLSGTAIEDLDVILPVLDEGLVDGEDDIERLAREFRLPELATLLSSKLNLALATGRTMLCARLDHACAVLLRAAQATERDLLAVIAMRERGRLRQPGNAATALSAFRRFDAGEAQALTRLVDQRMRASAAGERSAA